MKKINVNLTDEQGLLIEQITLGIYEKSEVDFDRILQHEYDDIDCLMSRESIQNHIDDVTAFDLETKILQALYHRKNSPLNKA